MSKYFTSLMLLLAFACPVVAQTSQPTEPESQMEGDPDPSDEAKSDETEAKVADANEEGFITLHAGVDFTTQYFRNGIFQENKGVIAQPHIELQMHLYRSNGPISDIYLFARSWNSFHSGPTGTSSNLSNSPAAWYETQLTAGMGVELFRVLQVSGGYTAQVSPNDRFDTVEELFIRGDLADKRLWNLDGEIGPIGWEFDGIRLYGFFVWETDGQRDGGVNRGVYAEVGAKPGVTLHPCDDFTVSLSVPVRVGFNVFEYQEVQNKGDAPFGFFTLGFEGEVPLKWIPSRYGEWSLYGAMHWLHLGQNAARFNNRNNDEIIATGGVRFNY